MQKLENTKYVMLIGGKKHIYYTKPWFATPTIYKILIRVYLDEFQ